MRKTPLVLLTWVLGTAGSVVVGSLGVQLVTSAVTPARVLPLTRPEVLAALSMDPAAISEPVTPPAAPPVAADAEPGAGDTPADPPQDPAPEPPPPVSAPVLAAGPPPAPAEPAMRERSGIEPRSLETQRESSREGSRDGSGHDSPATTSSRSFVRTIRSNGGTVAVRFGAGKAVLEWARPNPGFEVHVLSKGPVVLVEFESDTRESRIRAWWGERGPRQEVRESKSGDRDGDRDDDRDR
ncbi:MAG: hypothetical protein ACRDJO_00720 [Actinomycetota bacterium]